MNRAQKIFRRTLLSIIACLAISAVAVPAAYANLEFSETGISLKDSNGDFTRKAGAHPDFNFRFSLPLIEKVRDGELVTGPAESPRDVILDLPPGLVGNPAPFPTCSMEQLVGVSNGNNQLCPVDSQIGIGRIDLLIGSYEVGLFNLEHGPDVPARFGLDILGAVATITPEVRPDDYGISAGSLEISQGIPLVGASLTFWGNPTSSVHDTQRQGTGLPFVLGIPFESHAPKVPFFTTPTACPDSAQAFTARGDSWEHPGIFDERTLTADEEGTAFVWEGCENLPFAPTTELTVRGREANAPAGLGVHVDLPQNETVDGFSTSAAKQVALTLPEGMAISPSTAAGQSGCTQTQVGLGTIAPPACPSSSRLGTIELETPLLNETLHGEFVLAAQHDNPFGATYAVYMLIKGPSFYLKLPGQLLVDKQTGQLRTVFSDLPQLPFEAVDVELEGGPMAPLSTPGTCGTYSARSEITPWARPNEPVVQDIPIQIDQNCNGGGFAPTLRGGATHSIAGKHSPFGIRISRQDGEQNISRLDVTLPEGQLASLKGVTECPEALAPSGNCPASSQIGVAGAAIGVGSSPLQVPQSGKAQPVLFLGGPYKGAPLSLVALVPAQAGAFDLGNVVVRTALDVDPTTAQVTAKSDPLPQIIEGVPLQYRDIRIELTRPDFGVNPTSCEQMAITSTLTSVGGAEAHPSAPYQVADCASLGFSPSLKLAFKGGSKRTAHPAVRATLRAPAGQANIAKATVILPRSEFIDNAHIGSPCTLVQFRQDACPKGSILGTAAAYTPLLEQPLTGPVYFRSNGGARELPDLVADLDGQIHVTLVGFIDSVKTGKETSRVRTRFMNVPDAPVSKFQIKLFGGKKGLIQNSRDLCSFNPKAKVEMTGQNGKPHDFAAKIATSCGKKKRSR